MTESSPPLRNLTGRRLLGAFAAVLDDLGGGPRNRESEYERDPPRAIGDVRL